MQWMYNVVVRSQRRSVAIVPESLSYERSSINKDKKKINHETHQLKARLQWPIKEVDLPPKKIFAYSASPIFPSHPRFCRLMAQSNTLMRRSSSRPSRRRDSPSTSSSFIDGITITDSQLDDTLSVLTNMINDRRGPQASESTDGSNSPGGTAPDSSARPKKRS